MKNIVFVNIALITMIVLITTMVMVVLTVESLSANMKSVKGKSAYHMKNYKKITNKIMEVNI